MPQQPVQRKPQSSMNALMETWRRAMSSRTHTEEPHTACKSYTLACFLTEGSARWLVAAKLAEASGAPERKPGAPVHQPTSASAP
eukprot:scaffold241419_cov15-Tisochrysis_lutea.AAC.2